jgi:toluene monooxygenase system ferredoxin subunit
MTFQAAGMLDDVWRGEMRGVVVAGRPVLLVNATGELRAFEDRCAHQGVRLSEGRLEGCEVVCRAHEWRYDACTGRGTNPATVRLRSFALRVEGDRVLVDVDAPDGRDA